MEVAFTQRKGAKAPANLSGTFLEMRQGHSCLQGLGHDNGNIDRQGVGSLCTGHPDTGMESAKLNTLDGEVTVDEAIQE